MKKNDSEALATLEASYRLPLKFYSAVQQFSGAFLSPTGCNFELIILLAQRRVAPP